MNIRDYPKLNFINLCSCGNGCGFPRAVFLQKLPVYLYKNHDLTGLWRELVRAEQEGLERLRRLQAVIIVIKLSPHSEAMDERNAVCFKAIRDMGIHIRVFGPDMNAAPLLEELTFLNAIAEKCFKKTKEPVHLPAVRSGFIWKPLTGHGIIQPTYCDDEDDDDEDYEEEDEY